MTQQNPVRSQRSLVVPLVITLTTSSAEKNSPLFKVREHSLKGAPVRLWRCCWFLSSLSSHMKRAYVSALEGFDPPPARKEQISFRKQPTLVMEEEEMEGPSARGCHVAATCWASRQEGQLRSLICTDKEWRHRWWACGSAYYLCQNRTGVKGYGSGRVPPHLCS